MVRIGSLDSHPSSDIDKMGASPFALRNSVSSSIQDILAKAIYRFAAPALGLESDAEPHSFLTSQVETRNRQVFTVFLPGSKYTGATYVNVLLMKGAYEDSQQSGGLRPPEGAKRHKLMTKCFLNA